MSAHLHRLNPIQSYRHNTRLYSILMLTCLLILQSCGASQTNLPPPRPVKIIQVSEHTGVVSRQFPGRAKASNAATIAFEVAGRVLERPVNIGDKVTKGQLLVRLDRRDFTHSLDKAKAAKTQAQALRDRMAKAQRDGAVSLQSLTDAQAQLDAADAQLKIAQKALDDTEITAPFAGEVTAIYVEQFENVRAKQSVLRLLDKQKIEMVVNIPETLISDMQYVTQVWVGFDAFPGKEVAAQIKEISSEASSTTRTYPVTLVMTQPNDFTILPGMAAKTLRSESNRTQTEKRLVIPLASVFTKAGTNQSFVWIVDRNNNTVKLRTVLVERLSNHGLYVKQGLQAGEWLVTAGVHYLQDGQVIRIDEQTTTELLSAD